jgi:hypothetical protein
MVDQCLPSTPSFSNNTSSGMQSFIALNMSMFFSFWIIYQTTNGSISIFHLRAFTPTCLFQYALWWDTWSPLCLNFIMF